MNDKPSYSTEMLMAFVGFSLWTISDAAVRYLKDYPTILIAFLGSFLCVILLGMASPMLGGVRETLMRPQLKLRLLRGLLLAGSGVCSYYVFANLDLATAYAIIFAAPLLAKVLSVFITRENIRPRSWAITSLGFIGVLIVIRPGMIPISLGAISALILAFLFAFGYVMSRYIKDGNQTLLSMAIFQYLFITIATAYPAYSAYQTDGLNFSMYEYIALFIVSSAAISGSVLVAKAFSVAPTQMIAPIHYVQILWGALLSAFLFSEMPDIWTWVGGSVICFAGLLLIKFSRPV